jgi:hypothetical protein
MIETIKVDRNRFSIAKKYRRSSKEKEPREQNGSNGVYMAQRI